MKKSPKSQSFFSDPSFERARCKICGRPLKDAHSLALSMGRVCERRERMQVKMFTEEELEKCQA